LRLYNCNLYIIPKLFDALQRHAKTLSYTSVVSPMIHVYFHDAFRNAKSRLFYQIINSIKLIIIMLNRLEEALDKV